ncbi:hypothetical protein C0J52_06977 [Blattella germanica]|nr:hypothetical protein C0J52_06977 [Blattella germanica]
MPLVAILLSWQVLSSESKLFQVHGTIIFGSAVWIVQQIQEKLLQHMKIKFAFMSLHH